MNGRKHVSLHTKDEVLSTKQARNTSEIGHATSITISKYEETCIFRFFLTSSALSRHSTYSYITSFDATSWLHDGSAVLVETVWDPWRAL